MLLLDINGFFLVILLWIPIFLIVESYTLTYRGLHFFGCSSGILCDFLNELLHYHWRHFGCSAFSFLPTVLNVLHLEIMVLTVVESQSLRNGFLNLSWLVDFNNCISSSLLEFPFKEGWCSSHDKAQYMVINNINKSIKLGELYCMNCIACSLRFSLYNMYFFTITFCLKTWGYSEWKICKTEDLSGRDKNLFTLMYNINPW